MLPFFKIILSFFLLTILNITPAQAAISSCGFSISPSTFPVNSSTSGTFSISNNDTNTISWVKITVPPTNFSLNSASSPGWSFSNDSGNSITFTGGSISGNGSGNFTISISTGSQQSAASTWTVQVSDASSGSGVTGCSQSGQVNVTNDTSGPSLGSVSAINILAQEARISWNTDEAATGAVEYGPATSYGQTMVDSTLTTSHGFTLTNLSPNTAYHYRVRSTDTFGNSSESSDNTFVTTPPTSAPAIDSGSGLSAVSSFSSSSAGNGGLSPRPPADKIVTGQPIFDSTPPLVNLSTDLSKPFLTAPLFEGISRDNGGVKRIDYSIDNGRNWLPVQKTTGLGSKKVDFSFQPNLSEDGNYLLKIRAQDLKGNLSLTDSYTLVIDKIAPQIGSAIISAGAYIFNPLDNNTVPIIKGLDYKVTLSSIGGTVKIDLVTNSTGQKSQTFSLVKNPDNGLWSGVLSLESAGNFQITATAEDGAGKKVEKAMFPLQVLEAGKITELFSPVPDVEVKLYYFEPGLGNFETWDSFPFGQVNPQKTTFLGEYSFLLPPGRYYLQLKKPGFKTLNSAIFEIKQNSILNSNIELKRSSVFDLFSFSQTIDLHPATLPNFPVEPQGLDNFSAVFNKFSILGKPTLVTFLNTWSPQSFDQLKSLEELSANPDSNILVVTPQETKAQVSVFQAAGRYRLKILADPSGGLQNQLNITTTPTHLFLNSSSQIQKIRYGVLDKDTIINNLVN